MKYISEFNLFLICRPSRAIAECYKCPCDAWLVPNDLLSGPGIVKQVTTYTLSIVVLIICVNDTDYCFVIENGYFLAQN